MNNQGSETVAVLGASDKPDRYAYKAMQMLLQHGHKVFGVTPKKITVDQVEMVDAVSALPTPIDTLTVYVNPQRLEALVDAIVDLAPRRVIFNPGTESDTVAARLSEAGIQVEESCTLVLLSTGQF